MANKEEINARISQRIEKIKDQQGLSQRQQNIAVLLKIISFILALTLLALFALGV